MVNVPVPDKRGGIFLISLSIPLFLLIMPQLPVIFTSWKLLFFNLVFYVYNAAMAYVLLRLYLDTRLRIHVQVLAGFAVCVAFFVAFSFVYSITVRPAFYDKELILLYLSTWGICALFGRLSVTTDQKRQKEREVEALKIEQLKSRYAALSNQMHPHFFFNSLNSMSALIRTGRKQESLRFLNEMSRIFRYIMQIDPEAMTTLGAELRFIRSYLYMLTIRYQTDLDCDIDVAPEKYGCGMPALSLLPLVENVVKHNVIDGRHRMRVSIHVEGGDALTVENPVFEKLAPAASDKVGLRNLSERYRLLTGRDIRVENSGGRFRVTLPLTILDNGCTDS